MPSTPATLTAPAPARPPAPTGPRPLPEGDPRPGRGVADAGMATAEYAVATLAACGFAGLLLAILRGGEVRSLLLGIVRRALAVE